MMCKKIFLISFALVFGLGVISQGAIVNRYSFTDGDTVAVDSISGRDGVLTGTATISGNQLVLDGSGTVELPGDVLDPGLQSVTIEVWFELNAAQNWQRIFDFGETQGGAGGNTMFYTPTSGGGDSRFVIGTNGPPSYSTGEDMVGSTTIATDTPTHIACVYDGAVPEIRLYQDGSLVGSTPTTMSLSGVSRTFAYIGDAVYTSDPHLNGNVDEFRIYDTALTDAEVEASFLAGPDAGIPTEPAEPVVLLEDDFEGAELDLSKWQVLNGPDVNIVQADGQVFFDRPQTQLNYLITAEQYDPSVSPLTITGSAVTGPEGLAVWTRASNIGNTADSAQHVLDHGIRIPLWPEGEGNGWYDGEIIEKTAGTWPWSGLTVGNIPGAKVYNWDFVITDDGTTITATWTQSDDSANTFTLTAESTTQFEANYVAITVINGYLNDVKITTPPMPKEILLEDDFEGDALDLTKWQVLNGPDVNITQADGQVFFDRPQTQLNYLITAEQYDPSVSPLTITGSAMTGPEGLAVWTRASNIGNTADSAQHVLDHGIRIPLWPEGEGNGWYDGEIIEKLAGTWPWSGLTVGNIPGAKVYNWDFVITDDGTTITATWTQSDDPANTFTLTAEDTTQFDTNYVAFTVINGYLNEVTISRILPESVPIEVENFSFELPGTDKIHGFNGENPSDGAYGEYEGNPLPAGPDTDVPGWQTDSESVDSGIQLGSDFNGSTDGDWVAFIRSSNPALWQLTDHVIEAGDVIVFSVDASLNWNGNTLQMTIYYDDNGTRIPIASVDQAVQDDWQTFTLTSDVSAVPEAIGKKLGVEINHSGVADPAYNGWMMFDNVHLSLMK